MIEEKHRIRIASLETEAWMKYGRRRLTAFLGGRMLRWLRTMMGWDGTDSSPAAGEARSICECSRIQTASGMIDVEASSAGQSNPIKSNQIRKSEVYASARNLDACSSVVRS